MRRSLLQRGAFAVTALAACALVLQVEPASACSCGPLDTSAGLARADAAFIGVLEGKRPAVPGSNQSGFYSTIYTFRVQEVVKGTLGAVAEVWSAAHEGGCGLAGSPGQTVALLLKREGSAWTSHLCAQMAPERLRQIARPLPRPNGTGPVKLLVGGRFEPARSVALDRRGRALRYGRGDGDVFELSVCPGGRRVVERVEFRFLDDSRWLAVRETGRLRQLRAVRLPRRGDDYPESIRCTDRDAGRIVVFATNADYAYMRPARSRVLLVQGKRIRTVHSGSARAAALASTRAYLVEGEETRELRLLTLATGKTTRIASLPEAPGYKLALSPDGLRLAGVTAETIEPQVFVVELARIPAVVRVAALPVAGEPAWLDDRRLAVLPTWRDVHRRTTAVARLFDPKLRELHRVETATALDWVVAGATAYGVAGEFVLRLPLTAGPAARFGKLPGPYSWTIARVP